MVPRLMFTGVGGKGHTLKLNSSGEVTWNSEDASKVTGGDPPGAARRGDRGGDPGAAQGLRRAGQ